MEHQLCEMPQEEFEKHGCGFWRIVDGKRVCAGSPFAGFFRKRLAAVEAERDEMRKQMLEELGRADILEKRVTELEEIAKPMAELWNDFYLSEGRVVTGFARLEEGEFCEKLLKLFDGQREFKHKYNKLMGVEK